MAWKSRARSSERRAAPLDVDEACDALGGVSRTTVYAKMKSGELPYVKLGRRTLIMPDDIERLLQKHRVAK